MIACIKDILIGLTSEYEASEHSPALLYGLSLAQHSQAHVTTQSASVRVRVRSAWFAQIAANLVGSENFRRKAMAEALAKQARKEASATGIDCTVQTPHLSYQELLASFTTQARLHDLTILDSESHALNLDRGLIEELLIHSGRPLVVVPRHCDTFHCHRAIVAWDGSAKAARATNDALPLLRRAEAVTVLSVTGEKNLPGEAVGADLAMHLNRHGVPAMAESLTAHDGDVARTLRDAAHQKQADLIVMGAFVHWRLRELILGGVTQSLLKKCDVPLFMAY